MTVRDIYSRYYVVIHFFSKEETAGKLIEWITKTENYFSIRCGHKVGAASTDNGTEFVSNKFHDFCKAKRIGHQFTVPHISFENGTVKRAYQPM